MTTSIAGISGLIIWSSNSGGINFYAPQNVIAGAGWITIGIDDDGDKICAPFNTTTIKQQKVICGNSEGYECVQCSEFSQHAELNLPENEQEKLEFKCYSCRKGLFK